MPDTIALAPDIAVWNHAQARPMALPFLIFSQTSSCPISFMKAPMSCIVGLSPPFDTGLTPKTPISKSQCGILAAAQRAIGGRMTSRTRPIKPFMSPLANVFMLANTGAKLDFRRFHAPKGLSASLGPSEPKKLLIDPMIADARDLKLAICVSINAPPLSIMP